MLNHEDLQEILQLLDASEYNQLSVQTDRFKLLLNRDTAGWSSSQEVTCAPNLLEENAKSPGAETPAQPKHASIEDDRLAAVRAPLPGIFYRAPKPGSPAFIEVGSCVEANTLVCIIESMKLMNSVYAGVKGKVVEIVGVDGGFTEKSQVLVRIEPEAS
jgi:acetyl-CoA carboxylase biotin carboxyl carrier protein